MFHKIIEQERKKNSVQMRSCDFPS